MSAPTPPSAALLPPPPALRERLAVALREVDLLRRLIRAADAARPRPVAAGVPPTTPSVRKGESRV